MKLVLDTDVVVAAFRSPTGASAELLRLAQLGNVSIVVSVALMLEYETVMTRHEHLRAAQQTQADAMALLDTIALIAEKVKIAYIWRPQTRDPGDEMVLEAAINAKADALVTFNRRDFGSAPARFGIGCFLPFEALEKMR